MISVLPNNMRITLRSSKYLVESHRQVYGPVIRLLMLAVIVLSLLSLIPEYFIQVPNYPLLVKARVGAALVLLLGWCFHSQHRCIAITHAAALFYVLTMSISICLVGHVLHEDSRYIMPYSVLLMLLPGLLSIDFMLFIPCLLCTILVPVLYLWWFGCTASQWVMFGEMLLIASMLSFLLFLSNRHILSNMYNLLDSLREAAGRDALTGLLNRSSWYVLAKRAHEISHKTGSALAVLYIDIDFFKMINDSYGHICGDAVLCALSRALQQNLREGESVARFGGEEFVVLLPMSTLDDAQAVVLRLHRAINGLPGLECAVTVSVGAAELLPGEALDHLISRADRALLQAKDAGRNQTCLADPMLTPSLF